MENNVEKKVYIFNFNCTFGDTHDPMLKYFEKAIYPALKDKSLVREIKNEELSSEGVPTTKTYFTGIKLMNDKEAGMILKGIIVKETNIKYKNKIDEDKNIKNEEGFYRTWPYSTFYIFLKNHRGILIKNEGKSPDIPTIRATLKNVIKEFVNKTNKMIKDCKVPTLFSEIKLNPLYKDLCLIPTPHVEVLEYLEIKDVWNFIKNAKEIENFKLEIKIQNPSGDFGSIFSNLENIAKETESDKIEADLEKPKSKEKIYDYVKEINGKGNYRIAIKDKNNERQVLKSKLDDTTQDEKIVKSSVIMLSEEEFEENDIEIVKKEARKLGVYPEERIKIDVEQKWYTHIFNKFF